MNITRHEQKKDVDGKPIENAYEDIIETKTLNSMVPLWKQPKKDVTDEKLNAFYKEKFMDYEDPLLAFNVKVDGLVCYNALLYIPSHVPQDVYSTEYEKGLDLYAKGVFIQEKCKALIPDYLRFVHGLDFWGYIFIFWHIFRNTFGKYKKYSFKIFCKKIYYAWKKRSY